MPDLLHFEDFPVGRAFACGPYHVTKDEIVEFAREFDPQPHHLDEEAAKASILGGLAASGWHTCAMTMRMFADAIVPIAAARGGIGSPEGRWMKPVRPGDVLTIEVELTKWRGKIGKAKGVCSVDGEPVSEAEVTFMIVDPQARV